MKTHYLLILSLLATFASIAQQEQPKGRGGPRMLPGAPEVHVPAHPWDIVLGRPTAHSITLNLLSYQDRESFISYGIKPGCNDIKTGKLILKSGQTNVFVLDSLQPATRYFYQLRSRVPGAQDFECSPEYSFITARLPGSAFTFTLQADSHLDNATSPDVYRQTLLNALASKPDFHIDLGDTFMTDKYENFKDAAPQYLAQRYYFGLIGHSAPVFLVLGNHDGETVTKGETGPDSMPIWSNSMRKRYFSNPVPDEFYSGNATPHRNAGLLENYYSWQWGDALFVVLDPFWFTTERSRDGNNWPRTLGREQYDWLKRTLEASHAKYKFVFIHHLAGGASKEGRGGAEAAKYFEWGGLNLDGNDVFRNERSGWPMPIHRLLVQYHVDVVFHGHDHLYAKQNLDGIVYQEVPQPSSIHGTTRSAEEYGYKSGTILPSPGFLRIDVTPAAATVSFIGTDTATNDHAPVKDHYTIRPASK